MASESTKAWKDIGLSDSVLVVYRQIPLQQFIWFTLMEFAFRDLFFQSDRMYKYVRNIVMFPRGDNGTFWGGAWRC